MNLRIRKKHNKMIRNRCFCCGNYTLIGTKEDIAWDICPVCFWENDTIDDDNAQSVANHMTLLQGKENYKSFGACDKKMLRYVRKPKRYELPENNRKV